jgi:hypothetical protein
MAPQPRTFLLSAVPAAILAVAALTLAGCGGSGSPAASGTSARSSSPPTSSASASSASAATTGQPAQAPPAGYQWVGITAQHMWLAVPDSWVVLNLNDLSVTQAMERVQLKGQTAVAIRTAVERLKQAHGFIAVDTTSVATSSNKFATNVNAFCTASAMTPGPGAASAIISGTEAAYPKAGGQVISDRKVISTTSLVIVRIEVNLQTAAGLKVHELQFVDLTGQGQICYTTFSTDRPAEFFPQFTKMAATIQIG